MRRRERYVIVTPFSGPGSWVVRLIEGAREVRLSEHSTCAEASAAADIAALRCGVPRRHGPEEKVKL